MGRSHGIDGDYLGQVYKDHLSDYEHWEQKSHAKEWILIAKNMGMHLSIDECMYCGRLYTFVSNKDAHGGRGTIIAIIAGVRAETVLRWLLELPRELREGVLDVSMDFSDSMKLIAETAFPNARISLDRFHVFQDLSRHFMKSFSDIRDRILVEIKHEKAAFEKKVEKLGSPLYMRDEDGNVLMYKYELIVSHTARRSALTNLYKTGMFDNREMMAISGQKSERVLIHQGGCQ